MNRNPLIALIEESITLELNVAKVYRIFADLHEDDRAFWEQMNLEEKGHATLLRAAKDSFIKRGAFPAAIITDSLQELKDSNTKVHSLIQQIMDHPPGREAACQLACELEREAGELHYDQFMNQTATNSMESVFQQLNRDDKDHEKRILAYHESICTVA